MKMNNEFKAREAAKSIVYRRLADAFRPPEPELEEGLRDLEAALAWLGSGAHSDAVRMGEQFQSADGVDPLQIDFARLFIGPFLVPAPPYGSVYLEEERRIMGDSTIDARSHYLLLGLDLSQSFKEAPDHVSAELEFMHVLTCRVCEAIESGSRRLLDESLYQRESFLRKHIGAWIPAFTEKVAEHAQTAFYRHLAAATRQFVAEEVDSSPNAELFPAAETCSN